jgi:hypothetical protein
MKRVRKRNARVAGEAEAGVDTAVAAEGAEAVTVVVAAAEAAGVEIAAVIVVVTAETEATAGSAPAPGFFFQSRAGGAALLCFLARPGSDGGRTKTIPLPSFRSPHSLYKQGPSLLFAHRNSTPLAPQLFTAL